MRVCVLASGSSGNATLIVAGGARVLIDCGLSARETIRRILAVGEDPARLEACNLGEKVKFIRRGAIISSSQDFEIGAFRFSPFAIPHDAADPMAFTIEANGAKMGIAVDLGYINAPAAAALSGSDVLIIEANHEVEMLRACTFYPWALKQRIMSRQGHTSNDEMARFLREDFDDKAEHVVLAHLSRNTNHPAIARLAAVQALETRSTLFSANAEKRVRVASYDGPSDWIEL